MAQGRYAYLKHKRSPNACTLRFQLGWICCIYCIVFHGSILPAMEGPLENTTEKWFSALWRPGPGKQSHDPHLLLPLQRAELWTNVSSAMGSGGHLGRVCVLTMYKTQAYTFAYTVCAICAKFIVGWL